MSFPVSEAIMGPGRAMWHTPTSCTHPQKRLRSTVSFFLKGQSFYSLTWPPHSLVMQAATERFRLQYPKMTLSG